MPTKKTDKVASTAQPFIGGIVGGIVTDIATGVLKDAVTGALDRASHDPDLPVTKDKVPELTKKIVDQAVPAVVDQIAPRVQKEVDAVLENQTNSESLLRSRVFIGSVVSVVALLAGFLGVQIDAASQGEIVENVVRGIEATSTIIAIAGSLYALYGRIRPGLKPLGK